MSTLYVPYHLDEHVTDLNLPLPPGVSELVVDLPDADVWTRLTHLYDAVAGTVEAAARAGSPVTVVSGDCTVSIGIAAGLQRAGIDPALVWVDAHGDLQTLETSTSGYLGGTALRLITGYRGPQLIERLGLRPPTPDRVLLVDARDLDPVEADYLAATPIRRATVEALSADDLPDGPLLLNLDLDVLDQEIVPGARYPAPGGPDVPAVLRAARTILDGGPPAVLHIACCWNAGGTDPDGVRKRLLADLLALVA